MPSRTLRKEWERKKAAREGHVEPAPEPVVEPEVEADEPEVEEDDF
jgi:hypothetical protein